MRIGTRLQSGCDYVLEGPALPSAWWSFAVYDDRGLLIPNPADRYAFTSETVAPNPDGSLFISLAREARPGNWLPTGAAGRLVVVLTMSEPRLAVAGVPQAKRRLLPAIKRVSCR